jgi:hypothetical protein
VLGEDMDWQLAETARNKLDDEEVEMRLAAEIEEAECVDQQGQHWIMEELMMAIESAACADQQGSECVREESKTDEGAHPPSGLAATQQRRKPEALRPRSSAVGVLRPRSSAARLRRSKCPFHHNIDEGELCHDCRKEVSGVFVSPRSDKVRSKSVDRTTTNYTTSNTTNAPSFCRMAIVDKYLPCLPSLATTKDEEKKVI